MQQVESQMRLALEGAAASRKRSGGPSGDDDGGGGLRAGAALFVLQEFLGTLELLRASLEDGDSRSSHSLRWRAIVPPPALRCPRQRVCLCIGRRTDLAAGSSVACLASIARIAAAGRMG